MGITFYYIEETHFTLKIRKYEERQPFRKHEL
jgi:hypothetical protein